MADQPQPRKMPPLDHHCPVCGSDKIDAVFRDTNIPVGVKRNGAERNVVTIKSDVYACRSCGFLMFHGVGR